MVDLAVIIPTRGRPHSIADLAASFAETCRADTSIVLAVDQADPHLDAYLDAVKAVTAPPVDVDVVAGGTMVAALNEAAMRAVADDTLYAVGFMGDDNRPRSEGWDTAYLTALRELRAGVVYGDDLIQHDFNASQCAMHAAIVRAWGFMSPPAFRHLYVDTWWRDVANVARKLRYLPGVVVQHLHPIHGTAPDDEGYRRVNDPAWYKADEAVFWQQHSSGAIVAAASHITRLAEAQ
jgi:hypothetical protein